jgi:hypothetical protein
MKRLVIVNAFIALLCCTTFLLNYALGMDEQHEKNFRKFFCNETYKRKEITELPAHLVDVCKKSGIDPANIYVFDEDIDVHCADAAAWSFGNNIMLNKNFRNFDEATQAWYFAHELSHVKHKDIEPFLKQNMAIVDFQIVSSITALLCLTLQYLYKNSMHLSRIMAIGGLWGLANTVFMYTRYAKSQAIELRANDEATKIVGAEVAINLLHEYRWLRDHGQNPSIKNRLNVYKHWLGFCTHGSYELQIERLKSIEYGNQS